MLRRSFLHQTAVLAGASFLFRPSAWALPAKSFDYKIRMLRGNVGIFTERGGTIGFLLSPQGMVVIDSQFEDTAPHLIEELRKQATAPFNYLLNTHHHRDHSSGNIAFKGLVEHVVAHQNAAANQKAVAEKAGIADKQLYPDQTFDKDLILKFEKEKLQGYHFGPGHTNGDAVYHFEEANVMHLGDLLFNRRHPFVDRSTGANMRNWVKVLDKVRKQGDKETIYIFGHSLNPGAETGSAEDLRKFQDYLAKVLDFAEKSWKKGLSKEGFVKSTAIPGVTEWTGAGIERPLTAAYEEVSEEKK